MSSSKWRTVMLNVLTAISSLLVMAILAEGALIAYSRLVRPRITRLDSEVGWYHTPNVSGMDQIEGHRYRVSYNQHGYRGANREHAKPPGRRRVVVLGDSFVDGSEVGDDELFTWKMEQALPNVDVINLGVYGYQTAQELLTLEREGLKYSPDLVVLVTLPNDLTGNVFALESFSPAPRFVLSGDGLAFEGLDHPNSQEAFRVANLPAPRWIHQRSLLYHMLNTHIYQRLAADRINAFRDRRLAAVAREDQFELYRRIVLRIRDVSKARSAPLLVVLAHQRRDVLKDEDVPPEFAKLADSLRASGIAVIDLFEELQEQERKGVSPFYQTDIHWNVTGHEKVAEWILGPVRELLAGRPVTQETSSQ